MLSVLRYAGGKRLGSAWIAQYIKPHKVWVDVCCGGLNVTLANQPNPNRLEICNDIFYELINFYHVVKHNHILLAQDLAQKPYSQATFNWAQNWRIPSADLDRVKSLSFVCEERLELATKFFIMNRLSRDGQGRAFTESSRSRRGMPEMESSYLSAIANLGAFSARIKNIAFICKNALDLIAHYADDPDNCIYIDPPYVLDASSKRTTKKLYEYEVDKQFHIDMLTLIQDAKAQIIVSGFKNNLYDHALADWTRHDKPVKIAMGGSPNGHKGARLESLWINHL